MLRLKFLQRLLVRRKYILYATVTHGTFDIEKIFEFPVPTVSIIPYPAMFIRKVLKIM